MGEILKSQPTELLKLNKLSPVSQILHLDHLAECAHVKDPLFVLHHLALVVVVTFDEHTNVGLVQLDLKTDRMVQNFFLLGIMADEELENSF